jgi:type IV secretion system protein VirB1
MDAIELIAACAPLIHPATAAALVRVESGFNPYAIGVVDGLLARPPRSRAEAIATAAALQRGGWNFSVGLAQINVHRWSSVGLTLQTAFNPCANLRAMQAILLECFARARPARARDQDALGAALSCYASGDFETGFRQGYVRKVVEAARKAGG